MLEHMSEGWIDLLTRFDKLLGPLGLLDEVGRQLYPSQPIPPDSRGSHRLVLEGQFLGQLKAPSQETADTLGPVLILNLRTHSLQRAAAHSQARLIEEIKVRTELEEALKFMELKALQSQVNPHFLFNTLTTIAGVALFEDAEETNGLLQAMSRLLRYSLRMIGQSVSLREELSNVQDYLAIQQVRFGDRISVDVLVDESTLSSQIPVLTLQPLVENAIIHGLESREEGHLSLLVHLEGDNIVLRVRDNGVGIERERLQQIAKASIDPTGRSHTTGIGLSNVQKRLQHFFGTNSGFQIESEPGKGTCITLTIPRVL
jgi:sensor histidine kinase YesM